MYNFDANKATDFIIKWIQGWFEINGKDCNAIIGMSGGKDSTIAAALCVQALGKHRVKGVMLPNGPIMNNPDDDLHTATKVCEFLHINHVALDISMLYYYIITQLRSQLTYLSNTLNYKVTEQSIVNLPARLRMSVLYAVSQSVNGRVVNTCNASEDYVGYSTRWGDSVGDFSPLSNYTVTEVRQIGKVLGLPDEFVFRTPADGLCGKSDEDNLGFTYEVLDDYIRIGTCDDPEIKNRIINLHERNKFKLSMIESCPYYDNGNVDISKLLGYINDYNIQGDVL